ncbi:MAG: hypothetical protein AABY26_04470 [Nanoarchaeota archaeon]
MGNLIILEEKPVKAKGLNPHNIINITKLKEYFFEEDYQKLRLLKEIPKIDLPHENLTLLYPGCGADIFYPLLYLQELFPNVKEANFIFVDEENALGIIKTLLDEVGVNFAEDKESIHFYWGKKLIHLQFLDQKIQEAFSHLPSYQIYFEKAFRVMREQIPDYEEHIFKRLASPGVLISDSGFGSIPLERIEISSELSTYGEMILGIKR